MSKSEKRGFKLFCSIQKGEKNYIELLNIIDKSPLESEEKIREKYNLLHNEKNIETSATYLYQLLIDFLIQKRTEKSIQSQIFKQIEASKVLYERNLPEDATKELTSALNKAKRFEDDIMQLLASRIELAQASEDNFKDFQEKEMVEKHIKLLNTLKYSRTISQHNFLLNILSYRLLYNHYHTPSEEKEMLNDLVLNELHIISNNTYSGFQAEKIHLLFQSAYYIEIGNYVSAIRNYKRLLELFKENYHLIQNPPIYYLKALIGITDSLFTIGIYSEMKHFMEIINNLKNEEYQTDFKLKVIWFEYYYRMMISIQTGEFEQIDIIKKEYSEVLLCKISNLPLDIQLKSYIIESLSHFVKDEIKEAKKSLKAIFLRGKVFMHFPLYRFARIINLLIIVEQDRNDFIDMEITALKRSSSFEKLSKTESLILNFIKDYPFSTYKTNKNKIWNSYNSKINLIKSDKLERRILKYFDFLSYIESKITGQKLQEILKRKIINTEFKYQ